MAEQLVVFLLLGLGPGALIAGLALGLVLQYRGSGVINVATGAVAMFAAYVFYALHTRGDVFLPFPFPPYWVDLGSPWPLLPAFAFTLAVSVVLGVLLDLLFSRGLRGASPLAKLVASLGLLLMLQAIVLLRFGASGVGAPPVLPQGVDDVAIVFGVPVPTNRFMLAGFVAAVTLGLAALYRYTRFGLATRAAAENETAALLAGLAPQRLSLGNSVMASILAGSLGVLVAPTSQLDPSTLTFAVVPALGAALLARFTSFAIAAAAGLAMGIIQTELVYFQGQTWFPTAGGSILPGLAPLIYFLIIVGALYWRGASLPERGALAERRLPPSPRPQRIAAPAIGLTVICVVLLMVLPFEFRQSLINSLVATIFCLSLVVIAGFVGQVSIAQIALAGIAGLVMYHLADKTGIGFPLDGLVAVAVATVFGVLVGIPALRVRGVNLAIVTLAGAVAIERFGFENNAWGFDPFKSQVPPPKALGINLSSTADFPGWDGKLPSPVFGFFALAVALVLCLLVASLRRSVVGQQMLAVRSNERAAAAAGISVRNVKLAGFAISSAIAGLAGALYAYNLGSVGATRYSIVSALAFVAFAYIGGITVVSGAIVGGLLATEGVLSLILNDYIDIPVNYQFFAAGLALLLAVLFFPNGVALVPPEKHPPVLLARLLLRLGRLAVHRVRRGAPAPAGTGNAQRRPTEP